MILSELLVNVELTTLTTPIDEVIEAPSSPDVSINLQLFTFKVAPVTRTAPPLKEPTPEQFIKVTLFRVSFEYDIIAEPYP